MTAITKADIPASITTLEQLAAWACISLAYLNPTQDAIEGQNFKDRVAQVNNFYIGVTNSTRMICRLSFEMSPEHVVGGSKNWMFVRPFDSAEPVPQFLKS